MDSDDPSFEHIDRKHCSDAPLVVVVANSGGNTLDHDDFLILKSKKNIYFRNRNVGHSIGG